MDTHHDVKVARLLVIIAAAYALLGGVILVAVVVSWEAQVVFAPSISGSGVLITWFLTAFALGVCALGVGAYPRPVGLVSVLIAAFGFIGSLFFGPIRVTASARDGTLLDVVKLPWWGPVLAWSGCALFAIAAAVICIRTHQREETRLTSAST